MPNQIRETLRQNPTSNHPKQLDILDTQPFFAVGILIILGILISATVIARQPASMKTGETDSWWVIALNLVHGHGYSLCLTQYFPFCGPGNQATAMREPAPVLLFSLAAWLGRDSLLGAELIEALIYLAIIGAVYFLTLEWADTRSAILAAFLWTIYRPALELFPQVSGDLLGALFVSLTILFTLRARKSQSIWDWIAAGIWLGLAILSRSATLVIAAVIVGGQTLEGWHLRKHIKELIRPALIVTSLVIIIMAPWLIRNKMALGRMILGSSLTGYNLYRHNYMIGEPQYFRYVGPGEGAQAIANLIAQRPYLDGDENEAQLDIVYRREALHIIKAHPVQYLLLSAYRALPLWFDWKIAEAYGRTTDRYGYAIMFLQASLLVLACVGVRGNVWQTWPLWGSIVLISLAYMAVDARMLYVMPVMPLLISLSAVGGSKVLRKVTPKG